MIEISIANWYVNSVSFIHTVLYGCKKATYFMLINRNSMLQIEMATACPTISNICEIQKKFQAKLIETSNI